MKAIELRSTFIVLYFDFLENKGYTREGFHTDILFFKALPVAMCFLYLQVFKKSDYWRPWV